MKHFILPLSPNPDGIIRLYEKDYHYLVRVRRLKSGDCFDALFPDGLKDRIRIISTADKVLVGECLKQVSVSEKQELSKLPVLPPLALFQSLPKGNKMDLIVRQAAEGGLSLIVPFHSEHSQARSLSKEKIKRWERIIQEARQQSGSVIETVLKPPCSLDALLEYWASIKKEYRQPSGLILHQEPLAGKSFHEYLGDNPDYAALVVGPEGGFSDKELSRFLEAEFKPVYMGNSILRTETAALYGTAAMRIILLEKNAWSPGQKE